MLSFISRNSHYIALLLQEPWLNSNREPPPLAGFDMFIPTPTGPKCVIYIRKSAHLQPSLALNEADFFLGVKLSFPTTPSSTPTSPPLLPPPSFTLYNLYSPRQQQAVCHFLHGFSPATNAVICGDFNSHHRNWYGHQITLDSTRHT